MGEGRETTAEAKSRRAVMEQLQLGGASRSEPGGRAETSLRTSRQALGPGGRAYTLGLCGGVGG